MARIILFSGKGGVGKTTLSAATAVLAAARGHKTLVMSFDLAHSLADSFNLGRGLFDLNKGEPVKVNENLDLQEIDVQEELARQWGAVFKYMTALFTSVGVTGVVAEEVAIMPGMEDVISLLYINQYVKSKQYDVIIVDCPPTGDSLRFVNMTTTLQWYMKKRFKVDRTLVKLARPFSKAVKSLDLPEDDYFAALSQLFEKIDGVNTLLLDGKTTTVRLVTSAEKMVIRETQRAYMYFNMYGMTTDHIIVNRMFPKTDPYFAAWAKTQAGYLEEIEAYFDPVPVDKLPMFESEVMGIDRLRQVGEMLYKGEDPVAPRVTSIPHEFIKQAEGYLLQINAPFVSKNDIDMNRHGDSLVIRVGTFKRHISLPRSVARQEVTGAKIENGKLVVRFKPAKE
jgi:arsenite/tail-anchored protein-transporting ATPase